MKAFCDRTWHTGRLRYIGAVPQSCGKEGASSCCLRRELSENVSGTWFGVELVGASVGKGKSDGIIFGLHFFQTDVKCAVFVHAACIRPDNEPPALPPAIPPGLPPVIPAAAVTNVSTVIHQSVTDIMKMNYVD